jgi:hypothetical protein
MHLKLNTTSPVGKLVEEKHIEYVEKAKRYAVFYYTTRLLAGLSAAILPFIVGRTGTQGLSTALSIIIIIVTVFDLVFSPKDRWALFSKATDLLTVAKVKALDEAEYAKYKEALDTLLNTESANLAQVINLNDLVSKIETAHNQVANRK